MVKEKENPNHYQGKETGYELINGEYHIAPLYCIQFAELAQQTEGIKLMLEIVTSYAAADLQQISKAKNELWKRLGEDIGIDITSGWSYGNGIVKSLTKDKKPEAENTI